MWKILLYPICLICSEQLFLRPVFVSYIPYSFSFSSLHPFSRHFNLVVCFVSFRSYCISSLARYSISISTPDQLEFSVSQLLQRSNLVARFRTRQNLYYSEISIERCRSWMHLNVWVQMWFWVWELVLHAMH